MKTSSAFVLLLTCAAACRAASVAPSIEGVRLGVRDLSSAISWLDKVLGWKASYRDERRAVIASSGLKLELDEAQADSAAVIALPSADVDADDRRLLERGAVALEAPSDRSSGFREASLRGPGALTFELVGPLARPPEFVFKELAVGSGAAPKPTDTVRVRYVGKLKDGTVFDGKHRTGRPALIPLSAAVRCWTTALAQMKVGGRAEFVCPPELAYGKAGRPPLIPPNATLVFDVELVGIMP